MKKVKLTWACALMVVASMVFPSCLDDDDNDNYYATVLPNAIVTLKNNPSDGTFYMQLDDSTTLVPTNIEQHPYENKELRAFVNVTQKSSSQRKRNYDVHVNWIDTVRTKTMDLDLGAEANVTTYGNDPLEIVNDWATVVEDGYLTIRFRTYFNSGRVHYLRLVKGENPYEMVLHHDARGDLRGQIMDGYIAFRLNELPDTGDETVKLTLKWNSFSGEKSTQFKYRTRH